MKKLLDSILLACKGIVMGLANVIPGVSGGTLAVILGVFDRLIEAISSIFKKFKENVLFLIPVVLGMAIGILLGQKVIEFGLSCYPLATILLFSGMIFGGMPLLFKKVKGTFKDPFNYLIFVIIFVAFLLYSFFAGEREIVVGSIKWYDYFIFFAIGIIGASTMLMPGISGSLTLMAIGYYDLVVNECVGNIFDFSNIVFHLQVLIPFAFGCLVGLILISKIINYLLKHFEVKTYYAIFGFIFASMIIMFTKNLSSYSFSVVPFIIELIVGLVLLFIGFSLTYSMASGGVYIGIHKINFKNSQKKEDNKTE